MCGITGVIGKSDRAARAVMRMNDCIAYRGPDDEGFLLADEENLVLLGGKDTPARVFNAPELTYAASGAITDHDRKTYRLALGHRRLSILDLSLWGHMPMSYDDGRYWITYNGEVYNYLELKRELEELGHTFHSNSDTEVILAAYAQWGEHCLQRMMGMWAFAIYDHRQKVIFLARDRFGIKPLYYWFSPDGIFHFASEIKQFTVVDGWKARLNKQRAYDYLYYALADHTDECLFDGVFQLRPGHYIKLRLDDIKPNKTRRIATVKWYDFQPRKQKMSLDEAAAKFRCLFKQSVGLHLRSDVAVGSALSGGLDSSAIVCEVNQLLRGEGRNDLQKTFSSVANDERYSEKPWMDEVVRETEVDAHFVYPSFDRLFALTPKILWHQDEPYQSQAIFLGYHVFESARQADVKVLLNGQGADEYLSGYVDYQRHRWFKLLLSGKLFALNSEMSHYGIHSTKGKLRVAIVLLAKVLPIQLQRWEARQQDSYRRLATMIDIKKLGAREIHPFDNIPVKKKNNQLIAKHQLFYDPLPKYLHWEDRNSMAHSVEARVPFLDHRLVEFTTSLPLEYLDAKGETKRILVRGLKGLLPEKVRRRKDKRGFITPEERWVREDNPAAFREKLAEAVAITNGIITPRALDYFDGIVRGDIPFDYTYWRMILFAEWIKLFKVEID